MIGPPKLSPLYVSASLQMACPVGGFLKETVNTE